MNKQTEAMKLALEALDYPYWREERFLPKRDKAITALQEALAEQQPVVQEPVTQLGDGVLWCDTCRSVQETTHHTSPNDGDIWCKGEAKYLQGPFYTSPQPAIFNGWQPAETAPKDARILFLPKMYGNQTVQDPINICWWSEKHNGWRSDLCNDFGGTEEFDFWMPLPPIQQPAPVQCEKCNGRGVLAGYAQDGSFDGEDCPDCTPPVQPAQQEPVAQCTESDSWNCKYCRKAESCKALQDPRNFASPQPAQQEPVLQPAGLSDAVYTVLEGFTLPHDVRKILETAYYGPAPAPAPEAAHSIKENT